jgi:hypothetical protein
VVGVRAGRHHGRRHPHRRWVGARLGV